MSQSLYYSKTVKPTLKASEQHAAAYAENDLLFDWMEIEVPKHSARLVGCTVLMRGKPAASDSQLSQFSLYFATTDDVTMGSTGNDAVTMYPNHDILGAINIVTASYMGGSGPNMDVANVSTSARLTLTPDPLKVSSDTDPGPRGRQVIYMAGSCGVASPALDLRSATQLNDTGGIAADNGTGIALDGSSIDARKVFRVGDVIHAHDDAVVGTVASITDANNLVLTANNVAALDDDDYLYNIHPILIQLHFGIGG